MLEDLMKRCERAYLETFAEVSHSKTTLLEQRIHMLRQARCFRMDYELAKSAEKFGIPYTAKPLAENDWQYTYVTAGDFGVTQSYVQKMGCLPNPAKFRDTLAKTSNIPQLPLEDDAEIFKPRNFYGLFAHNPVGAIFEEEKQKLGSIQLCVPYGCMRKFALEVSIAELLAEYPSVATPSIAIPAPTWKRDPKRKDTGTE
ncbi:hypothetical protein ROLI_024890 [Roseobacter fucihabitans]|uniref:Uncharacterized protein n=2 Tax=Roseobacter fucihabitans TaxID=1537242 RepID=A0ABZ2BVA0_9RHOB|nr:hypothetical protein [Roseobacter litoralis]